MQKGVSFALAILALVMASGSKRSKSKEESVISKKEIVETTNNSTRFCTMPEIVPVPDEVFHLKEEVKEDIQKYSEEELVAYPEVITPEEDYNDYLTYLENTLATVNAAKLEVICQKYLITEEEFRIIVAVVTAEARGYSKEIATESMYEDAYNDAYAVANVIYNRMKSYKWHYSIDSYRGEGAGSSPYFQVIQPEQFVQYENGAYLKYLNDDMENTPAYQATLDMLYSGTTMHNYLYFSSNGSNPEGKVQFVSQGNRYYNALKEEDTIPLEYIVAQVDEEVMARTRIK